MIPARLVRQAGLHGGVLTGPTRRRTSRLSYRLSSGSFRAAPGVAVVPLTSADAMREPARTVGVGIGNRVGLKPSRVQIPHPPRVKGVGIMGRRPCQWVR